MYKLWVQCWGFKKFKKKKYKYFWTAGQFIGPVFKVEAVHEEYEEFF